MATRINTKFVLILAGSVGAGVCVIIGLWVLQIRGDATRHITAGDAIVAEAIKIVFEEYVDEHGLDEIADVFGKGVKIEVGDMLPSAAYAKRLKRMPPVWEKGFEVNPADDLAVRASCVEFVLAGLYVTDRVSRSQHHGRITYEI